MKKKLLYSLGVVGILSTLFFFLLPLTIVNAAVTKVKICHSTGANSNPYRKIVIDNDAIIKAGHDEHTGSVWYDGITIDWGDIIPPFDHSDGHYDGMNWIEDGIAIWNNDCKVLDYEDCDSTIRSWGEWSEWEIDPNDPHYEYRERTVYIVDAVDSTIQCAEPIVQREYQYIPCSSTYRVYTTWTAWAVDQNDLTQEFRTREVSAVDSLNSQLICAGPITETEYRDIEEEYDRCSVINTEYGEWSEWTLDPEDDTQEFRTRTFTDYDSENSEYVCNEDVEIEYRDIEDEGDVLGESDEKGEVLGTSIVSADTAGGSNPIINIIEYLLIISTGISFIFLGKRKLQLK